MICMESINVVLGIANLIVCVIFIILAIPFKKNKVKRNWFYSFRFSKAFASDENWYQINEYGASLMLFWSIPLFLICLISFFYI